MQIKTSVVVSVKLQIVMLIADLPAKASILFHKQFNGEFGCNLCYCPGTLVRCGEKKEKTAFVRIYDTNYDIKMRNREDHLKHLVDLRSLQTSCKVSKGLFGVLGESYLEPILANLPMSAPIDYMQRVLL